MKEALSFSETLVLTRVTRRNIAEDTILHDHRRENLKSYNYILTGSVGLGHAYAGVASLKPASGMILRSSHHQQLLYML
jgi:hypothetical protein